MCIKIGSIKRETKEFAGWQTEEASEKSPAIYSQSAMQKLPVLLSDTLYCTK